MSHDLNDTSKTAHLNEIMARYKTDVGLQREYPTVYAWFAANGYDVPSALLDPPAERPDVEAYISSLSTTAYAITGSEKAQVQGYANTWQVHADIRNEFRSFESYAAFMRARARGHARIAGRD